MTCLVTFAQPNYLLNMDEELNQNSPRRPQMMEEQCPNNSTDIFEQFLIQSHHDRSMEIQKLQKPIHYRSTKNLVRRSDFRKILNSSSSNQKLIPSSIKNDSSRQNSEREGNQIDHQNSIDSQSNQRTFKKKFQESFSVSHTIRDSSSEFSERSNSKSSHNIIIPQVYKQEEMIEQKKLGCNCKRSKCLKLYCECFQKQLFCSNLCNCQGCGNHKENNQQHKQAVIEALARNAYGFQEDQERENISQKKGFSLGVVPDQVRKGCKCKKTKCLKKYCQCYQSGIQCTIFCRCQDCNNKEGNHKHLSEQSLQRLKNY